MRIASSLRVAALAGAAGMLIASSARGQVLSSAISTTSSVTLKSFTPIDSLFLYPTATSFSIALVTIAAGSVTVTATSEGKSASAVLTVIDANAIAAFVAPFTITEYKTSKYFDHNIPKEFIDNNGVYTPWWGENSLIGIDGHSGYDWQMPVGTPIRSVAAGTVFSAGLSAAPVSTAWDHNAKPCHCGRPCAVGRSARADALHSHEPTRRDGWSGSH